MSGLVTDLLPQDVRRGSASRRSATPIRDARRPVVGQYPRGAELRGRKVRDCRRRRGRGMTEGSVRSRGCRSRVECVAGPAATGAPAVRGVPPASGTGCLRTVAAGAWSAPAECRRSADLGGCGSRTFAQRGADAIGRELPCGVGDHPARAPLRVRAAEEAPEPAADAVRGKDVVDEQAPPRSGGVRCQLEPHAVRAAHEESSGRRPSPTPCGAVARSWRVNTGASRLRDAAGVGGRRGATPKDRAVS